MSRRQKWITVEVLACETCGTLTVALGNEDGGLLLTSHKCAGSWRRVAAFDRPINILRADVAEAIRAHGFFKAPEKP